MPERPTNVQFVGGHYADWGALVSASVRGDRAAATRVARGLSPGGDADAEVELASALAFVALAEDADELAYGLTGAARACGSCHAANDAPSPPRPGFSHHEAGNWLIHGLVWNAVESPPLADDPIARQMALGWGEPVPADTDGSVDEVRSRTTRALTECISCHERTGLQP